MNNKHKRKPWSVKKLLAAILMMYLFVGGNPAMASFSASEKILTSEQQQTVLINGLVFDVSNEPMVGVTIKVKGTNNGTVTDMNGRFSLNVQPDAILVVSYLGYKTQEVSASQDIKIFMTEDNLFLEELVVVGYSTQKKKLVTGATVQVKGDDISKLNTTSILGALQSQSPGVEITQVSGFIGDGFKVNIRGLGTNGNSSPLYVVDGVAGASIDGLSPNDIESIDVLKDAATAAIYGARGANGVILVTTKRGKEGRYEINYDGYYGIQNIYKIPTLLNAQEYMAIQDESRVMNGLSPWVWETYLPGKDLDAIRNGSWKGTNWLKEILNKDAPIQNHSISITNGSERSVSSLGVSYMQQEATMGIPSAMPEISRLNARINSEHKVLKYKDLDLLKIGETLNYRFQTLQGSVARDDIYWNSIHNMLIMSPLMHVYNEKGNYYMYPDQKKDNYAWDVSSSANKNPIAYMDYYMNQAISKTHSLQSSFYADLQPVKNLHIRSQFGYMLSASTYRSYMPAYGELTATLSALEDDRVTQSASSSYRWTLDNTVNYIGNFGKHNFDLLIGESLEKWGMGESISGSNLGSSYTDFEHAYLSNVPGTTKIQSLTGYPEAEGAISSFFGRVNYNYLEKYMASVIMRADGSSTFARGHRWGYFPSLSAGWVISNEDFWSEIKGINFLKLRASYGQNGNCMVTANQFRAIISSNNTYGGFPFGNSMGDAATGAYPPRLTNPDLKWETQDMVNVGIDAQFFHQRLSMELEAYSRTTIDWLVTPGVPGYWGASPASVNGGNVKNSGLEWALRWNDRIGKDFNYKVNLSTAYNKNEVTKIASEDAIFHGLSSVLWEGSDECYRAEVGKPMGFLYGYKSAGIFQNKEQINSYQGPLLNGSRTQPGDVIWVDVNKDGVIDEKDRTMIGNPHPKITLGFSFNIEWKGIEFDATTYGAFGHQILKCYRDYIASPLNNYTTDIYNRWHGEGTSNKYPRLASSGSTNWARVSDLYIENGDYLKIKNVTLGYDFKKVFKKLPVQQLKLYVTAQNLFTFTGYSGMDPEIGYSAGNNDRRDNWTKGIDLGFYPSARTYMVGANIKF